MSKYINAELYVDMQIYDNQHEEWGAWRGTIEELLDQWTDQGCPPTIESRPKGKWKEVDWGKECTNCKHEFDREIEYICRTDEEGYILPKYCPMCGARIIGEEVGEE